MIDTDARRVVLDQSIVYGSALPEYRSPHGFLEHADPAVKHADPRMWVEALDRLLEKIKASGFDLASIAGISGAGQQHGSVYLKTPLEKTTWSTRSSLSAQLAPLLSRATAPIWMDSSTAADLPRHRGRGRWRCGRHAHQRLGHDPALHRSADS